MLSLLSEEHRERARRRRRSILCLGALGRPLHPRELNVALGDELADALDDAVEEGFANRLPDGRYGPTPRCRFEVGIVLAGTVQLVQTVLPLVGLAQEPLRRFLLEVASDPLGKGLSTASANAALPGAHGALARALIAAVGEQEPDERERPCGDGERDVLAALTGAAFVCVTARPDVALALLRWGLGPQGLEGHIAPEQAFLAAALSQTLYELGDRESALALCRNAQAALGEAAGDFDRLLLKSLEGQVLIDLHRMDEARQLFTGVEQLARAERWLEFQGIARLAFGNVALRDGNAEASVELFKSALQLFPGSTRYEVLALHCLGLAWSLQGRHVDAQRALSETLPLLEGAAFRINGAPNAIVHDAFMGDLEAGAAKLAVLEQAARAHDSGPARLGVAVSRAYLAAARACWTEALAHTEAGLSEPAGRHPFTVALATLRAACLVRLRRIDEAAAAVDQAAHAEHLLDLSWQRAMVQILEAEVALARGEWDRVRRVLRRAAAAKESLRTFDFEFRLKVLALKLSLETGDGAGAARARAEAEGAWHRMVGELTEERRARFEAVADRPELLSLLRRPDPSSPLPELPRLRGTSPAFRELVAQLRRVGPSQMDVLILGETGAGKELCARALHELSPRQHGPFVALNCAALTDELLLSELFGHEKGAFTGAMDRHIGRFERAHGGTLFLDEIGDISPRGQAALLRALQERTFERVGGVEAIRADVRVVAATNRDLAESVLAREFREDLYYRLAAIQLRVPPLRERREDVLILARGFLEDAATERAAPVRPLSEDAERLLLSHPWPGNVRELRNALRAAELIAGSDRITAADLAAVLQRTAYGATAQTVLSSADLYAALKGSGDTLRAFIDRLERELILQALVEHGDNLAAAAAALGLTRSRLSQIVHADPVLRAHRRSRPT